MEFFSSFRRKLNENNDFLLLFFFSKSINRYKQRWKSIFLDLNLFIPFVSLSRHSPLCWILQHLSRIFEHRLGKIERTFANIGWNPELNRLANDASSCLTFNKAHCESNQKLHGTWSSVEVSDYARNTKDTPVFPTPLFACTQPLLSSVHLRHAFDISADE